MTKQEFLDHLHDGDFGGLFRDCLWDNPTTRAPYSFQIGDAEYQVREAAQKKGFRVYVCNVDTIPDSATRRLIDSRLRKVSHDYLAIYVRAAEPMHHLWSVPVKTVDKRELVTVEYASGEQAAFLVEKMNSISFTLDEDPTIIDVAARVNAAFLVNTTDVTRQFYQQFRKQHDLFVKGIENISGAEDREWYASVMLNRLMFCYFIQKKGFLDFDEDYLGHKLKWVQEEQGRDKFYGTFYKRFLKELFSGGLDGPPASRPASFAAKYGRIPYLNGGMFSLHRIEAENKDIDIPDAVFERLFAFFDQWRWHLDSRITASGRDINPDVLGYIFEQYINDRAQMGAYYTKEDITEYIGRNTIVPWLVEKAGVKVADAVGGEDADRYIFPAMRKGVDLPLPPEIEKGVAVDPQDLPPSMRGVAANAAGGSLRARRAEWNKPADAAYALPTEIWRETVARRQRCEEIRAKFANGEITDIHDFITYNLDIRAFAEDVIRNTDDHRLVLHFYKALREITILDPTCGSGAFLFAALNILEPLYEACLDRMEEFHAKNERLFQDELAELGQLATGHSKLATRPLGGQRPPNRQYFICKSIILRNLYGVDIMHEAVEIARLRLFLKMVAVVDVDADDENLGLDPLPDIDFNIRCGNTLVGYASEDEIKNDLSSDLFAYNTVMTEVNEEMTKAAMAFDFFQREQLNLQGDRRQLAKAKDEINKRSGKIRDLLNDYLFETNGGGKTKERWLADTQPFHWYTEFYPIMAERGGFDVIIGNPPYVVYTDSTCKYQVRNYQSQECGNLFAFCIERSSSILNVNGRFGMIVPISAVSATKMQPIQHIFASPDKTCWISNYSLRPAKLFEGAEARLTIIINVKNSAGGTFTTNYQKWNVEYRCVLFRTITYFAVRNCSGAGTIPKLSSQLQYDIYEKTKVKAFDDNFQVALACGETRFVAYYFRAVQYWFKVLDHIPVFREDGEDRQTGEMKPMYFTSERNRNMAIALLSSNLFFMNYIMWSSCQVVNSRDFCLSFPFEMIPAGVRDDLCSLAKALQKDYQRHSKTQIRNYSKRGRKFTMEKQLFYIKYSKPIIDEIDELLAKHYGFTEEELDFIINYDIKYRMGDELNAGE